MPSRRRSRQHPITPSPGNHISHCSRCSRCAVVEGAGPPPPATAVSSRDSTVRGQPSRPHDFSPAASSRCLMPHRAPKWLPPTSMSTVAQKSGGARRLLDVVHVDLHGHHRAQFRIDRLSDVSVVESRSSCFPQSVTDVCRVCSSSRPCLHIK